MMSTRMDLHTYVMCFRRRVVGLIFMDCYALMPSLMSFRRPEGASELEHELAHQAISGNTEMQAR